MTHSLNNGLTPTLIIFVIALFIGVIFLESKRSGISIWRRLGEAIAVVAVAFGCFVTSVFVGAEYGVKTFLKVTRNHYKATWAHHINARPIEHVVVEPKLNLTEVR